MDILGLQKYLHTLSKEALVKMQKDIEQDREAFQEHVGREVAEKFEKDLQEALDPSSTPAPVLNRKQRRRFQALGRKRK